MVAIEKGGKGCANAKPGIVKEVKLDSRASTNKQIEIEIKKDWNEIKKQRQIASFMSTLHNKTERKFCFQNSLIYSIETC